MISSIWTTGSLEYTLNPTTTLLVNGVSYDVQVRAVVGSVQHPWAGVRSATPRTTPGAPAIDSVRAGDLSLVAEWSAPASDGGAGITAYDVRHIPSDATDKSDDQWTVMDDAWISGGGALKYTVSGLTNDVQYDVRVRAVNAAGDGLWSTTAYRHAADPAGGAGGGAGLRLYERQAGGALVLGGLRLDHGLQGAVAFGRQRTGTSHAPTRSTRRPPMWSGRRRSDSRRYRHGLDGLTNGTELTRCE